MKELIKPTDGIVSKYINRRISVRITLFLVRKNIRISPNQMSVISFVVGIASALGYLLSNPLIAGIGVQVSSIIDGVDGELARLLGKTSKFGGFFDALLDRFVDIAIILSVCIYLITLNPNPKLLLAVGMLALSGDLMVSYMHARGEASLGEHPLKIGTPLSFSSRDVRLFIIFLGSIVENFIKSSLLFTLIIIAILSYGYVVFKMLDIFRFKNLLR